jgi:hypothetical protein
LLVGSYLTSWQMLSSFLVVEGCSTATGSHQLMGALLKSLELTFLFIAIFIFVQTVE